jgi:hypothetical protein
MIEVFENEFLKSTERKTKRTSWEKETRGTMATKGDQK